MENKLIPPAKGMLLVSEPFLPDPHFHRSVVLLVEHNEEGTVGLVLNQPTELSISDLFEDFPDDQPVCIGGPVSRDSLLFIHSFPSLEGSAEIMPGVFWGGDFEQLRFLLGESLADPDGIRYFAGYSGWGPGQLEQELEQKSWLVVPALSIDIFSRTEELWKNVLRRMGPAFRHYGNAPEDVQLN